VKFTRVLPAATVVVAGALAFTLRTATATPTHATIALDDPTIVAIFDEANTADIETGELAAKMGSTKTIREFGAMLARDHKNVRQQGRDLAKKLNVTPTPPKPDEGMAAHAAAMKSLRAQTVAPAFAAHRDAAKNMLDKQAAQ
jgi:putative membrane protein